jgi:D-alanyl-D-alanine carboxypeptidase/D-alanyl-D-alanine-endopeptidase (penicillin-binding protein 4)
VNEPAPVDALGLPGASLTVLAVARESGRVIASASPDRALAPASNTKLITAGLALDRLGPDYRYESRVLGRGPVAGGVLEGDLRFVGSGAPDVDPSDLSALAAAIGEQVDRVGGDLLVDGTRFSGGSLGPGWTHGDQRHSYGAPSTAAALDRNQVTVSVTAGDADAPSVSIDPETPTVSVDADVDCDPDATADDLRVSTDADSGAITVRGEIPPDAGTVERTAPVPAPERHLGFALRSALADAGVALDGTVRVLREEAERSDDRSDSPAVAAAVESASARELVREMNVPSDNFVAEQLARTVARAETGEGSWDAWEAVVAAHFEELGVETVRIRDGSGLSRYNLVPARGLIEHLRWVDERPWSEAFFDSLPTPGTGTLSDRLDGVPVAAKTGTITGTSALSGVVRRTEREDALFAVVHGGLTVGGSDAARDRQDAFVRWLAG